MCCWLKSSLRVLHGCSYFRGRIWYCTMADERARITRLETRAREADTAMQQLRAYIELLRSKKGSSTGAFSEEAVRLEEENASLRAEVDRLKQQLVTAEVRNGVPQIPLPSQSVQLPPQTETTPTTPAQSTEATPTAEAPKTNKKPKAEKKKAPPSNEPAVVNVSRLDFRIGRIVKAWKHPDADALYVEEVDVGESKVRTVCSGLTKHVPLEEMQDRVAMFLCNLKPAKMRGVMSEAMIMCASTPEKVEVLTPPTGCKPGDRVYCEGYTGTPDVVLNPKKKIFEAIQPDLKVDDVGVACYKTTPFKVEGHDGVFTAPTLRGVGIK